MNSSLMTNTIQYLSDSLIKYLQSLYENYPMMFAAILYAARVSRKTRHNVCSLVGKFEIIGHYITLKIRLNLLSIITSVPM